MCPGAGAQHDVEAGRPFFDLRAHRPAGKKHHFGFGHRRRKTIRHSPTATQIKLHEGRRTGRADLETKQHRRVIEPGRIR